MNKNLLNNNMLDEALSFAITVHKGQKDRAGLPYILHPLRIMMQFTTFKEMTVAILHDVIEDSDTSIDDLRSHGFSEDITFAVDCLSKRENEEWDPYLDRVQKSELAIKVKIEDLKDNMNYTRLNSIDSNDLKRMKRYHYALLKLTNK